MADIKREQERDELHRAIWNIADELRGSVDGWDFKSYVLGTMFYRYISENLASYINAGEIDAGDKDFDYAKLPDSVAEEIRDEMINSKGFLYCPPSCSVMSVSGLHRMKTSTKRWKRSLPILKNLPRGLSPRPVLRVCSMISM